MGISDLHVDDRLVGTASSEAVPQEAMRNGSSDPTPHKRNITWQVEMTPKECAHEYETVAREENTLLQRCSKCGNVEAEWTPGEP
jgi:hypothetical protein